MEQQYNVAGLSETHRFQRMKIGTFHGGHEVKDDAQILLLCSGLQGAR